MGLETHRQKRLALLIKVAATRLVNCHEDEYDFLVLNKLIRTNARLKKLNMPPRSLYLAAYHGTTTMRFKDGKAG